MRRSGITGLVLIAAMAVAAARPNAARAQVVGQPAIDLPDPFGPAATFGQLPPDRSWGGTTAVAVDADGRSVWVFERCGGESCANSKLPPILHFDPAGKLLASFGAGMFVFPHGITVDRDGNVWVADADGKNGKGQQVVKFSPTGKVLLTLGHKGMPGDAPGYFNRPSGVAIARNGDIFVAESGSARRMGRSTTSFRGRTAIRLAPRACRRMRAGRSTARRTRASGLSDSARSDARPAWPGSRAGRRS